MRLREIAILPEPPASIPPEEEEFWIRERGHSTGIELNLYYQLKKLKIETSGIAKILVWATDPRRHPVLSIRVGALGVQEIIVPFDFGAYRQLSDEADKASTYLDAIATGCQLFAREHQLDGSVFEQMIAQCRIDGFQVKGVLKKSWRSPDRQWLMKLGYCFTWDRLEIEALLCSPKGIALHSRAIGVVTWKSVYFLECLEHAKWVNNEEFVLLKEDMRDTCRYDGFRVNISELSH